MPGRLRAFIVVGLLALAGAAHAQDKAALQWFSQAASSFKLTTPGGKAIMIDPWLEGATKLPDEFTDLGKLGKVDLILVTHGHGDHLGDVREGLVKPKMAMPMHHASNPFLKGPAEFKAAPGQTSIQVTDINPGDKKQF
jgi:glyoxylase-like metal-dependent hydrolase (beta-lactamase superfamily II)